MSPVRIRPAGRETAGLLARLHGRCFTPGWDAAAIAGLTAPAGTRALVAWAAGEPAGFVICRVAADEAEILSMGVVPELRRRGLGRRLLQAALGEARGRGARSLVLEVAEGNAAARRLYDRLGLRVVARRDGYYREARRRPETALVMARELAP